MKPYAERTNEKMKEVLMTPEAPAPDIHYYMIRGGSEKTNITVWEPGTVGDEYIKAYGHYHIIEFSETYTILEGEGFLLLQVRKKDSNGKPIDEEIESFKSIKVKAGDSVDIPPLSGHILVNTGSTWLVTSDNSPVNIDDSASMPAHADYESIEKMHGFAYYIIKKDGVPTFVKNPRYISVPDNEISS